jgi:hypothetical protein
VAVVIPALSFSVVIWKPHLRKMSTASWQLTVGVISVLLSGVHRARMRLYIS